MKLSLLDKEYISKIIANIILNDEILETRSVKSSPSTIDPIQLLLNVLANKEQEKKII